MHPELPSARALLARGNAIVLPYADPFKLSECDPLEVAAGTTLADALRQTRVHEKAPGYAGVVVVRNGESVSEDYEKVVLGPGDRVIARAMPADIGIVLNLFNISQALQDPDIGIEGILTQTLSDALGLIAGPGGVVASTIGGYARNYGGGLGLGSSESGSTAAKRPSKRVSPTASGVGNQILHDHPPYVTIGDCRVTPPHLAIPFQPGIVDGNDQDPSARMVLGVAGDSIVSDVKLGKTAIELLDIEARVFRAETDLDFPTASVQLPGQTLRDEFVADLTYATSEAKWFTFTTDDECDELSLIQFLAAGLMRVDGHGGNDPWQLSYDVEYRAVGAGSWDGFFKRDASGNSARSRVPSYVQSVQTGGDNRWHVFGKTTEPFFFYLHRPVVRDQYDVRLRLRPEPFLFTASGLVSSKPINRKKWTSDRGGPELEEDPKKNDKTNTVGMATDPQIVQFAALRDEPAVEGFTPGLSGIEIRLNDETTKSDQGGRISFRSRRQVPNLSGGARTAATTTSNPVAYALDILTGPLAGSAARPDSEIDFPSFQIAFDYCNELVPTVNGGTEVRHQCAGVLDAAGVTMGERAASLLSNFRMKLIQLDGKYQIVIDRKRTAPRHLLAETDLYDVETDLMFPVQDDATRVEFFNGQKDGEQDELVVYNPVTPAAGLLANGGFAAKTANKTNVSTTITRSGDYALIAINAGTWSAFPEDGWVCIRWPGGTPYADARLFLIDSISSDLLTLTVIDKAGTLTAGTRNGTFDTTAAVRIGSLSLDYVQRPSEAWRQGYYLVAQKNRPRIHTLHSGLEWLAMARGDMIELSSWVPVFGKGSGRLLAIDGTLSSCTGLQFDEEFDLTGLTQPAIKLRTRSGSSIIVTRKDVDAAATTALRASNSDNRWLAFAAPQNLSAIGLVVGGGNGSVAAFGEKFFETRELIVKDINGFGEDFSAKIVCFDHAPEIFDSIVDQEPVPRYESGVTDTGIGERTRPPAPACSATEDSVSTPMRTINASAPASSLQDFTRTVGEYAADGFTATHKVSIDGYANAANNVRRLSASLPSASVLRVLNASGVLEAGTGDERVRGVVGTVPRTLHIDRAATGVTKLDVNAAASGAATITAPSGLSLFAGFRSTGWVELRNMPVAGNDGWWEVTARTNDTLTVSDPGDLMVTSTGTGNERAHQAQVHRNALPSLLNDGLTVGDRVFLGGFAQDIAAAVWTIRAASAVALAFDDPFGLLVSETGSGDETITRAKVAVAFELAPEAEGQGLRMLVTIPLRPGAGTIVSVEDREIRYRLRDLATARASSGWIGAGTIPANEPSATFGPIPVDADWDFAARDLSRVQKTPSDYMVVCGDAGKSRPPAPTNLQVHGDTIASAEGQRFALRVEWAGPDTSVRNYLLRYQRRGDSGWSRLTALGTTSVVIADARIGTYDLELYTLSPAGEPSVALLGLFDFEPDRDFEHTTVQNLRLLNPASGDTWDVDPRQEFTGPDALFGWAEPDFTGEFTPTDTAGINSGLDPLVREFELQVFDPETNTELRRERGWTQREYRYSRAMNAEDQARVFSRGPHRDVGLRVWMHSVTNRTSAASQISVANPMPEAPTFALVTSTPGDSASGLKAVVHVAISQGNAKDDDDFRGFAVWAGSVGFTPSPANYQGVSNRTDNKVSFPFNSGITRSLVVGSLDDFHPTPDLITDPSSQVALLAAQSFTTVDGAVPPFDTDDIVLRAVTEAFTAVGIWPFPLAQGPNGWTTLVSLNAAPSGGGVDCRGDVMFEQGGQRIQDSIARLVRNAKITSVLFFDATGSTFADETEDAFDAGSSDVPLSDQTTDYVYTGSLIPYGAYLDKDGPRLYFDVSVPTGGSANEVVTQYWDGSAWPAAPGRIDGTDGWKQDGTLTWALGSMANWTPVVLDTALGLTTGAPLIPLYWTRHKLSNAPSSAGQCSRIYLYQVLHGDALTALDCSAGQRTASGFAGKTIEATESLETIILQAQRGSGEGPNGTSAPNALLRLAVLKR